MLSYDILCGLVLQTRKEKFMGWYHSHPFDVEVFSHCHLSGTDVQTQLAWQRAQDVQDFPWLAIVVSTLYPRLDSLVPHGSCSPYAHL